MEIKLCPYKNLYLNFERKVTHIYPKHEKKLNVKCWMEMYNYFDITNELILCEQAIDTQTAWITKIIIFLVYITSWGKNGERIAVIT